MGGAGRVGDGGFDKVGVLRVGAAQPEWGRQRRRLGFDLHAEIIKLPEHFTLEEICGACRERERESE